MKNKFNIGDRLWPIYMFQYRSSVGAPFDVNYITSERNEIKYSFTPDHSFYEINVFSSEDEAKIECDKRNGIRHFWEPVSKCPPKSGWYPVLILNGSKWPEHIWYNYLYWDLDKKKWNYNTLHSVDYPNVSYWLNTPPIPQRDSK